MLRVVADTNVYISALNFRGVPDRVIALARRRRFDLFVSRPILDEVTGVLRKKFGWSPRRTRAALALIRDIAHEVRPDQRVAVIEKDEADNRILECALAANATIVISGDSHLLELGSFRQIRILRPRELLDSLGEAA